MKKFLLVFANFLVLFLLTPSVLKAQDLQIGEVITVQKEKIVNKDYFARGENINILGTINGDAYLLGSNILVDGDINGDLIAAGGKIEIRGKVEKNVRIVAGQIIISGDIGGNTTTGGGNVEITNSANLYGSLVSAAGNLSVYAPIQRGATIASGDVILGNQIGGDVLAAVASLSLSQQAQVSGDLTYYSQKGIQINSNNQVSGKIVHNYPKENQLNNSNLVKRAKFGIAILSLIISFLVGVLLLKIFPVFTNNTASVVANNPIKSFFVGLLGIIITPILAIILIITIIGIPITFLLLIVYILYLFLAKIFVALAVGQKALAYTKSRGGQYLAILAGLLIYTVLGMLPIIGPLIAFLVIPIGYGAIVSSKFILYKTLRTKKLI